MSAITFAAVVIGKGRIIHHTNCGMVRAATVTKTVEYNANKTTCKQCRHMFAEEIAKMTIGIDTRPTFRLVVIAPWAMEKIEEDRFEKLLSNKKPTHNIRVGISTNGKNYPFHLAMDSYCSDNGYTLVERKANKGQMPTELNEYLITHADAVIIYNDGHWMMKRAIKYCEESGKRHVVMEVF